MSADCYFCKTKVTPLSTVSWAISNEPVGACRICHAFACGYHGTRMSSPAAFQCIVCKPVVLIASAADLQNKDTSLRLLKHIMALVPRDWLVKTIKEFIEENPEVKDWLSEVNERSIRWTAWKRTDPFRNYFEQALPEARQLLVGAALLIKKLYAEGYPEDFPEDLQKLATSIDGNNLNSNYGKEVEVSG